MGNKKLEFELEFKNPAMAPYAYTAIDAMLEVMHTNADHLVESWGRYLRQV